jgi:hypothetical protein
MSGIPKFNIPAFQEQANKYEAAVGCVIVCPYELDSEEMIDWCLRSPDGVIRITEDMPKHGPRTWAEFMLRDLKFLQSVHGIALMPGWHTSRGARVEVAFGIELGLQFLLPDFTLITAEEMRKYASKNTAVG